MSNKRILIVDDEPDIVEVISFNLQREGFNISSALNGKEAITIARETNPDLVLLDLMLPDISGFDVCRSIKALDGASNISVIMLTAKGEEADVVAGLELGADDYITKPFSQSILLARIRSVLRRKEGQNNVDSKMILIDELKIDPERHEVFVADSLLDLTATEFRLLHFLCQNQGKVFTRDQIIHAIHGTDYPVTRRSIDVQITGLRKKLLQFESKIETIRGVGYRFGDSAS